MSQLKLCHNLSFVSFWVLSQFEFCNIMCFVTNLFCHNYFKSKLVFHTICFSSHIFFLPDLSLIYSFVLHSFCYIPILVSSQFSFHHNKCLFTTFISALLLFHHNFCFLTIFRLVSRKLVQLVLLNFSKDRQTNRQTYQKFDF